MFERFTEKAIKIVTFSQQEAISQKHFRLDPEHILIGIMMEGSGIAARFLRAAGLKVELLRENVNRIMIVRQAESTVTEGLTFSPAVKRVLKGAWDEAKSLGANYIGPEHLFLSLLNEDNSIVEQILADFSIDINRIKSSVIRVAEKKSNITSHPEDNQKSYSFVTKYFSIPSIFEEADSSEVMNVAREKLKNTNYEVLGTEQIFLSMLENRDSQLPSLLESVGVSYESFVQKLQGIDSRADEYDHNECQFTPRAFFAINSAYELAKEFGSASIKPEHLLLGILKEKKGIAYRILNELGVDSAGLFAKIMKPIEKQKPVTLTIIRLAKEEARRLGHKTVGTEQILLGIIGEATGIGAKVLKNLGITLKDARIEVEKVVGYGNGYQEKEMLFTPRAKKLLEIAWDKAKKFNQPRIESEHLLLGITNEKEDCMAMRVLENLGVDVLEIRQGILRAIEEKALTAHEI